MQIRLAASWQRRPLWVVGGQPYVVLEVDVHHGLAADIESAPFFQRAVNSIYPNALTLSSGDHLWFTISRYYNEVALHGKRSLRDFAYSAALIHSAPDWDRVLTAASEYSLHPSLYYYLYFLNKITSARVPSEVLNELFPVSKVRLRDWGWQIGKLFDGVEPWPHS
jgi:hypothetical protein